MVGLVVVVRGETDLVVGHGWEVSAQDVSVIIIVVGAKTWEGDKLLLYYPVHKEQAVLDAGVSILVRVSGVDVENGAIVIIVSD